MQRTFLKILAIGLLFSLAGFSLNAQAQQSLADIARENKEKQAGQDAAPAVTPKVITNQDLGEGPEGRPDLRVQPPTGAMARPSDYRPQQRMADQRSEQWKRQIGEQENRVANLQARLDQINASIHANSNAQGSYYHYQAVQQERASQIQLQLDEQKTKLDAMQDAARRAGMKSQ